MCGHLNLKLAVGLNVKSIFRVSQSASFLLCTSMIAGGEISIISVLNCFFILSILSLAGIHTLSGTAGL